MGIAGPRKPGAPGLATFETWESYLLNGDLSPTCVGCDNFDMRSHLAVVAIIAAALIAVPRLASQTDSDWQWMDEHFLRAFDDLFPIQQRVGIYVAYRSHRDLYADVPEYGFVLGRMPRDNANGLQPSLSADVRVADGSSLYDQLLTLHRKRPDEPFASTEGNLKIREWRLTETNCPAVKSEFELFQQLKFPPPKFDEIVIHGWVHEIQARAGTGDMRIDLSEEHNPLVEWAVGARRAFDACTKKMP